MRFYSSVTRVLPQGFVLNLHRVSGFFSVFPWNRTEQNRTEHDFIGLKSIYKGLLPKQHIKYKTK